RQDAVALNHLGAVREQAGGRVVVALVERLAPGADDALRRGRAGPAACDNRGEREEYGRPPHASASRTSPWKCASSRSLSGSSWPPSSSPECVPRCTDSTSARSSRPTWSSKASNSSISPSVTSSAKK